MTQNETKTTPGTADHAAALLVALVSELQTLYPDAMALSFLHSRYPTLYETFRHADAFVEKLAESEPRFAEDEATPTAPLTRQETAIEREIRQMREESNLTYDYADFVRAEKLRKQADRLEAANLAREETFDLVTANLASVIAETAMQNHELQTAIRDAIAYMENQSSDADHYHAEMMQPLRAALDGGTK